MMIWDAVAWMIIAKVAVMLFEDAAYAVRGQKSPRMKERARRRDADAAGRAEKPSGAWGRAKAAAGDYVAGLVEDGAGAARSARRRRRARKRGLQAVDGVLVDVDEDTEGNARWYADCDVCGWSSRPFLIEANARIAGAEHARTHVDEEAWDDDPAWDDDQAGEDAGPARAARCPSCGHPEHRPGQCTGIRPPGLLIGAGPCQCGETAERPQLRVIPGGGGDPQPAADQPEADQPEADQPAAAPAEEEEIAPRRQDAEEQPGPTTNPIPNTSSDTSSDTTKELTVNLEATGPEEIRSAFATAMESTSERAEEISGLAAVLTEAADRYESLEMAASTVAHINDAAVQYTAAAAALQSAGEELEAALADFNARDGQVGEAVADAGNLASQEVLVGG